MEKGKKFFNTTLGLSMLPDGGVEIKTLSLEEAIEFLKADGFINAANPFHGNTLQALTQMSGVDLTLPSDAKASRVYLEAGDQCLVAEVSGIPRETREFSDEEIAAATFRFRLVTVVALAEERAEAVLALEKLIHEGPTQPPQYYEQALDLLK